MRGICDWLQNIAPLLFFLLIVSVSSQCSKECQDIYQYFIQYYDIEIDTQNCYLYALSADWLGGRYRYGGRDCEGIDCSGLVKEIFRGTHQIELEGSSENLFHQCVPITFEEELCPGDLLFFKIRKGRISHVGIYLGNGKFIHSSTQAGVIISSLSEPYYRTHFYAAGRLRR